MQKMLEFIRSVRDAFGENFYLWAYTNGALFTKEKGMELAKAGLDELRFDISADDYRLEPLEEASGCFKNVTIEIPAIPEDEEALKRLLEPIRETGTRFLNLHQLNVTRHNCQAFADRGYTLIREESKTPPILESEITALRIMQYALQENIGLPVNYCSQMYKMRFQYRGRARVMSGLVMSTSDEPLRITVTATGLLRVLSIQGENGSLTELCRKIENQKTSTDLYRMDTKAKVLFLHPSLLLLPGLEDCPLEIRYYRYGRRQDMEQDTPEEIPVPDEALSGLERIGPLGQFKLSNEMAKVIFHRLFLEAKGVEETLTNLGELYDINKEMKKEFRQHLVQMLDQGKNLEYMDTHLPAYR